VGDARADARALEARRRRRRARPARLPVMRPPDPPRPARVCGGERATPARVSAPPGVPPVLADGALELLGLLPRSSNYAFLARAVLEPEEMLAVYKPRR